MPIADPNRRVRIALIGAGIYARDAHTPALLKLQDRFEVVAVFSRTAATATALAAKFGADCAISTDLAALLARPDVEAVDVVLPIDVQAAVVAQALASGKHVVSEKPLAPDVETAQRLLAIHRAQADQVWMVAENWRYEDAFVQAAAAIQAGAIGRPLTAHWAIYLPMTPASKYYATLWRRSGTFQGGFLLDGGVHYMAVLRFLLGEVETVAAHAKQINADLPPADTLTASVQFANGVLATLLVTYAANTPWAVPLTIVGDRGSLRVERGKLELSQPDGAIQTIPCRFYSGVEDELAAFADAIRFGAPQRNTPEAGLRDLQAVETLLRAAELGQTLTIPVS